jgi:hypothetical protein
LRFLANLRLALFDSGARLRHDADQQTQRGGIAASGSCVMTGGVGQSLLSDVKDEKPRAGGAASAFPDCGHFSLDTPSARP